MTEQPETALQTTAQAHRPAPNEGAQHLTQSQLGQLLRLHREGLNQSAIAQHLGVNQSTVSRALQKFIDDNTDLAQTYAKASAFERAVRLNRYTRKRDKVSIEAIKELNRIAGLGQDAQAKVNIAFILNGGRDPFANTDVQQVIEAQTVDGAEPR